MVRSVRVRRAVRRPGKCEESDNQETGLCVVTLRASKWLPTTIYRPCISIHVHGDTVRERDTHYPLLGGDWLERNKALGLSGRAIRRNGGELRAGRGGVGWGGERRRRSGGERKRLPWRARSTAITNASRWWDD